MFTVPEGQRVGDSKTAARVGIFLVCISRVIMAVPGMSELTLTTRVISQRPLKRNTFSMFLPDILDMIGFWS